MSFRKNSVIIGIAMAFLLTAACQSQYMTSAKVYLQQNETDNAIRSLEQEIDKDPTNGEAYFLMAECLHAKQRYSEINQYLDLALQNNPKLGKQILAKREEMWRPFFNRALSLSNAGRMDQALNMYNNAREIHPDKPDTYYALGYIYYQQGDVDKAIESWESAVAKGILSDAKNANVLRNMGNAYFANQNYEKAAQNFQLFVEKYAPGDIDAMLNMAMSYEQIGQKLLAAGDTVQANSYSEKVQNIMTDASKSAPDNPTVAHDAGLTLFRAGRYDMAKPYLEKAVELDPTDKESWTLLAQAHFQLKEPEEAMKCYNKVLELDPEDYIAMRNIGIILGQLGRSEEAIQMIQKASEMQKKKIEERKAARGSTGP